ncbi:MAG: hypothetical protein HY902_12570 [Deltaproteobacteria bacterium]|nr:hypothetical protein [Deltaproteobacteria bacterium]
MSVRSPEPGAGPLYWLAQAATLAVCAAVAWFWNAGGAPLAASAWRWFTALGAPSADARGWGQLLLRGVAALPKSAQADPLWAVQSLQLGIAAACLYAAVTLAHRVVGLWAALPTALLLAVWPAARHAIDAVSAESLLTLASLLAAHASVGWNSRPRASALLLGVGTALAALAHPLGVLWAPALALITLVLPVAQDPSEVDGSQPRPDMPVGDRFLAWLAAVAVAVGLVLLALRPGGLGPWGTSQFAALRHGGEPPDLGTLAALPMVGPLWVVIGQWPLVVVLLAVGTMTRGVAALRKTKLGGPAGVAAVGWVAISIARFPQTDHLDAAVVLAPMAAVMAGVGAGRRLRDLAWLGRRPAVGVWAAAAMLLLSADLWVQQKHDRRSLAARAAGLPVYVDSTQSARLGPDDIALLQLYPEPTAVLPARSGGADLATSLRHLLPRFGGRSFGAAHSARVALLPEPPRSPIDRALAEHGKKLACTQSGRRCAYRLAVAAPGP